MTMGERIAALRKEKGLSQEALGELVGVTRQAVSKWESDRAIPDVNNCVAMSKVFNIPLANLLELEEVDPSTPLTLDEAQLKLVKQLTQQYDAAQKRLRRRWRWPVILLICALLVGGAWFWEWLRDMDRTIDYLSGELAGLQGEIVSGVGDRVQESLEAERSLITDYTITVLNADPAENKLTYEVTINLKEATAETQVRFLARVGGEIVTAPAKQKAGLHYSGQITCPIADDTAIYLESESDGQARSQLLEIMNCAGDYQVRLDGWVRWAALTQSVLAEGAFEPVEVMAFLYEAPGLPKALELNRLEIVLFCNDMALKTVPIDLSLGRTGYSEWILSAEMDVPVDLPEVIPGDTLTFVLMAQDNYGRVVSHILSCYLIEDGGKLQSQGHEVMGLNDGTYGTEGWK